MSSLLTLVSTSRPPSPSPGVRARPVHLRTPANKRAHTGIPAPALPTRPRPPRPSACAQLTLAHHSPRPQSSPLTTCLNTHAHASLHDRPVFARTSSIRARPPCPPCAHTVVCSHALPTRPLQPSPRAKPSTPTPVSLTHPILRAASLRVRLSHSSAPDIPVLSPARASRPSTVFPRARSPCSRCHSCRTRCKPSHSPPPRAECGGERYAHTHRFVASPLSDLVVVGALMDPQLSVRHAGTRRA